MGCGACAGGAVVVPHSPTIQSTKRVKHLLKNFHYSWFLTQNQCDLILKYIQSSNLPQFDDFSINVQQQTITRVQSNSQKYIISNYERVLWKVLLLIPEKHIIKQSLFDCNPQPNTASLQKQFQQIARDTHRTFSPILTKFQQGQLKTILENITVYYQGVGYTQGMNYYVGFFLLCGFTMQEAFWMFICLSQKKEFMMIFNFTENFALAHQLIRIFQIEMKKHLPTVLQKLQNNGIMGYFYSFSWFLCYFLYSLSPVPCAKIWSYMIRSESNLTLIRISLAIMKTISQQIQKAESSQQLIKILRPQGIKILITQQNITQVIKKAAIIQIDESQYLKSGIFEQFNNEVQFLESIDKYRTSTNESSLVKVIKQSQIANPQSIINEEVSVEA